MRGVWFLFVLFLFALTRTNAQNNTVFLLENKGQWPQHVLASTDLDNGKFYLEKQGFTYDFVDEKFTALRSHRHIGLSKEELPDKIHHHVVKVRFVGAQQPQQVVRKNASPTLFNDLRGSDKRKWIRNARAFGEHVLKEIYPGIDLKFYSIEQNLKYDLIVEPGVNPEQIRMDYRGADQLVLRNNNLQIQTSLSTWQELKPYAYQEINGKKSEVSCKYTINKQKQVGFELGNYDKSLPLIIDPVLVISTYSGSTANNFGYTATYDSYGYLYSGSSALVGPGYPVTTGAFDEVYSGGDSDVAITKYDTTGTFRVYSTLIGGKGTELPHSLVVDSKNQLIIFGTTSSSDFPMGEKGFDTTFHGGPVVNTAQGLGVKYDKGSDIFVSKLNFDGSDLIGGTFLGGTGSDGINLDLSAPLSGLHYNYADEIRGEVLVDDLDNCYIVTTTTSTDISYISPGSFQPTLKGGLDGVLFKLDYNFENLIWASYLGGSANDAIYAIDIDQKGRVVVSGGTASQDLEVTDNAFQKTYGGGRADGFVAMVSATGDSIKTLSYWGSAEYDQIYLHEFGNNDDIFLFGQTEDNTGHFFFNHSGFGQSNSGQFITKISGDADSLMFSLTFGNGTPRPNISPTAFLVDNCGNIYTTGWGGVINMNVDGLVNNNAQNTVGMPTTAEANPVFRQTTDKNDFHIMILSEDAGSLVSGFYFGEVNGQDHVDGGTSRFDKKSQIYQSVCASCGGRQNFPTTAGAVSTQNGSSCNNAVFKIDFQTQGVAADFAWTLASCANDTIYFDNRSFTGLNYVWDFGDNSAKSTTKNPFHIYATPGVYYVTLKASNVATCNQSDSIVKRVVIYPVGKHILPDTLICLSDTTQLGLKTYPGASYSWFPGDGLSDSTVADPFFFPSQVQQYRLIIDTYGCHDTTYVKTTVDGVVASFANTVSFCYGDSIFFNNQSISADKYLWDFGDGDISTGTNPAHKYNFPGVYKVTLHSTTFNPGPVCLPVDSMVRFITVFPSGVHHFPDTTYCKSDSVYIGYPAIPGATYKWTPGIGLSSTTISRPLLIPTVDTVYRLVITANGCHDTSYYKIKSEGVLADFNGTFQTCIGNPIGFNNRSKNANGYFWDFGDNTTSFAISPSHTYLEPGQYKVKLNSFTNNPGKCPAYDSVYQYVRIYPNGFGSLPDTVLCLNDTLEIGPYPIPGATYVWVPTNGLSDPHISNPVLTPDSTRKYTLYTSALSCRDTLEVNITTKGVSANFTSIYHICGTDSVSFTNSSIGADTYLWRFDDGTTSTDVNPKHSYATPGDYYVTLISTGTADNPCPGIDSVVKKISVHAIGNTVLPDTVVCRNDSTQIGLDPIPGATYKWIPSYGLSDSTVSNPYLLADSVRTYTLTVNAFGCMQTIKVKTIPKGVKADFYYSNALCAKDSVRFTNTSMSGNSYNWSFGDNGISSIKNPKHIYDSAGTYTIRLIASGTGTAPCPAKDTVYKNITIYPNGKHLLPDGVYCFGDSIQIGPFVLPGANYHWSPSAGLSNPNIPNPYAFPDTTTTYVLTTFSGGCIDSTFVTLKTGGAKASFSVAQTICSDDSVFFQNNYPSGEKFIWNFGDGNVSIDVSPTHKYDTPGVYSVTLYSITSNPLPGCNPIDSMEKSLVIFPSGIHHFPDTIICRSDSLQIGYPAIPGATYTWTPAIGLSDDSISNPILVPQQDTVYRLVILSAGCADTSYYSFKAQGLSVDFDHSPGACENSPIFFSNASYNVNNYSWNFGDNTNSTDKNPTHTFSTAGTYVVTLTGTNFNVGNLCPGIDSVKHTVNIYPVGFQQLNDTVICRNDSIQLGPDPIPGATYAWSPSQGISDTTISNPIFTPDSTRIYTLITSAMNCYDTLEIKVEARGIRADFNGTLSACVNGDSIRFNNTSLGQITYRLWRFGDGQTSTDSCPVHKYNAAGVYDVTLITGTPNAGLCSGIDSVVKQVMIYPDGSSVLPSSVICINDSLQIGVEPIPGATYTWTPTAGLSDSTISNPYLKTDTPGNYTLTSSAFGCVWTLTVPVLPKGVRADFNHTNAQCLSDTIHFTNTSVNGISYTWDFGDLNTSTAANPSHAYALPGVYNVRLVATANGSVVPCPATDTIIKSITIYANGKQLLPDQSFCLGDSVQIGPAPLPGSTYYWSPATGLSSPVISNPYAKPDTITTYTLIAIANGCLDSTIVTVKTAGVKADFAADIHICQNDTVFFTNKSINGDLYTWSFGDNTNSNDTNTFHVYSDGGTFLVTLVATTLQPGNCPATHLTSQYVNIYHSGNHPQPDTIVCVGDTVRLGYAPLPGAVYTWTPGLYLSDSTTSNPVVIADSTITYTMIGGAYGCLDTLHVKVDITGVKANFSPTNPFTCQNDTFLFTNTSKYADTYQWYFSDGGFSTDTNTSHYFAGFGKYFAKLIATRNGTFGHCPNKDTLKLPVYVYPDSLRVLANPLKFCLDTLFRLDTSTTLQMDSLPGASYFWSPTYGLTNYNWANPIFDPAGDAEYTLITTAGQCSDTLKVKLESLKFDLVPLASDVLLCSTVTTLKVEADGKGTINSFMWSDTPDFSNILVNDSVVIVAPSNMAKYYVRGYSDNCAFTDSIQIFVLNNGVTLDDDSIFVCRGQNPQIGLNSLDPNITFEWHPTDFLSDSTVSNPISTSPDTIRYELKVTTPGCFGFFYYKLNVDWVELTTDDTLLRCDSLIPFELIANGYGRVNDFTWDTDTLFNSPINPTPLDSVVGINPPLGQQKYYIRGITNQCHFVDSLLLFTDYISLGINDSVVYCVSGATTLDADNKGVNTLTYDWEPASRIPGPNTTESVMVYIQGEETFTLKATNQDGCTITDTILVTPSILLDSRINILATDSMFYNNRPITVSADPLGSYNYSWHPASYFPNPHAPVNTIYLKDSLTISLSITDGYCTATDIMHFDYSEIICGPPDIFVPNAFTPNTDKTNDLMLVRGNHIESLYFAIYDRWGERVFETNDQKVGWDGKYKGKILDPAVFVYYLEATCKDKKQYFEKGNITLIR